MKRQREPRDDDPTVYVWGEYAVDWRMVRASRVVCPECGRSYAKMNWLEADDGDRVLRCPCGESFYITSNHTAWIDPVT